LQIFPKIITLVPGDVPVAERDVVQRFGLGDDERHERKERQQQPDIENEKSSG
jgi:hypothetical protein